MPKFYIRLTLDEDMVIDADNEDDAEERAMNEVFDRGLLGVEIREARDDEIDAYEEDEDGDSWL